MPMLASRFFRGLSVRPRLLYIKEVRSPDRTLRIETIQSFILSPSSFILHPSSFILYPSSFILFKRQIRRYLFYHRVG